MTTARIPLAIDESYISELLEVAASILQRHPTRELAEKAAALEPCWELLKQCPELAVGDAFPRIIADLNEAVFLHLNTELEAAGTLLGILS